ncbi:hypothetical protein [Acinetobacter sp.]|uniref:hypothetical protein n=1 Tax=Acinetobacter sp. TaxID=472 RepID=UPI00289FE7B6|nr:hypothetical protein [Acinetobacter sp.]
MNTKLNPYNSFKVTLVAATLTVSALALAFHTNPKVEQPVSAQNTHSEYGIVSLKMLNDMRGEAVVNLDGFRLEITSFEVEAHLDDYGVPGSEFTNVEVVELGEIKVFDANGNPYNDFTDYQDHREINSMIAGYIMKHRLVEVQS